MVSRHHAFQPTCHPRSFLRPTQPTPPPPFCHSRTCHPFLLLYQTHGQIFSAQRDIRHLNFAVLRDAGYRAVIFDKDNCLVSTSSPFWRGCAYHAPPSAFRLSHIVTGSYQSLRYAVGFSNNCFFVIGTERVCQSHIQLLSRRPGPR